MTWNPVWRRWRRRCKRRWANFSGEKPAGRRFYV
jgi:hypothetical protein